MNRPTGTLSNDIGQNWLGNGIQAMISAGGVRKTPPRSGEWNEGVGAHRNRFAARKTVGCSLVSAEITPFLRLTTVSVRAVGLCSTLNDRGAFSAPTARTYWFFLAPARISAFQGRNSADLRNLLITPPAARSENVIAVLG
jgi:hypothetical protein